MNRILSLTLLVVLSVAQLAFPVDVAAVMSGTLNYTALGDSLAFGILDLSRGGYVPRYGSYVQSDTDSIVALNNLGKNGWTSSQLLIALRTDSAFRTSIANSQVVTWNIGGNDFLRAASSYQNGTCGGADNEECVRSTAANFKANWSAIIAEILTLRSTSNTVIRTMDVYNPFVGVSNYQVLKAYLDDVNQYIASTTNANNIPCAKVYRAFNGPNGDEDAGSKGYLSPYDPSGVHPSDLGHKVIADLLRNLGYAPLTGQPVPTDVQAEVRTWTIGGTTQAFVKVTFPDDSYTVANWGAVVPNNPNFAADAQVTRGAVGVSVPLSTANIYTLGTLAPGNYTFTFRINGTTLQTHSFSVSGAAPAANPIDTARTFVFHQYADFLSREPDGPGWDFWEREITVCGSDAQCIDRKRVNTSGAFFLSSEFQGTGYFVYRVYKGALNRRPRFVEFLPEVRQVAAGIVVNNALSPQAIDSNKRAFALAFVGRDEFRREYPEGMSNVEFVNRLVAKTGVTVSSEDRAALVAELDSGAGGQGERRARVLYRVVDGTRTERSPTNPVDVVQVYETSYGKAFYDQEFNRAFVLMQYLGYLRRDPDEGGYGFWLAKLNQFGNFTDAEMVKAFIVSAEYRSRFGQP